MELEEMKTMLGAYKKLLEREKQVALNQHFHAFMEQLKIEDIDQKENLELQFTSLIEIMEKDLSIDKRMLEIVNSKFIWAVMQHKTSAKERELRRLTADISAFIMGASKGVKNEQQFIQNLLARSLKEVAESIESGELKTADTPVIAWVSSMKDGLFEIFDKQKI